MEAIFNTPDFLLLIMFLTVALGFWLQRYKMFKSLGPALTVIVIGIVLSNLKIVPVNHDVYGIISGYCVPLSICICLLSLDLKEMRKLSKEPIIALFSAVFSVCLMAFLFGLVFATKIDEGWKVAGMFVGTYTGGSSNLTAIAVGLDAARETIAAANAADYVIGIPTLIFMFASPAILKHSKFFNKIWPYHHTEEELLGDGDHTELMAAKEWSIQDIAWMLAIGFTIVAIATKLAGVLFGEGFRSAGRIILITTMSIIVAQLPQIKKLRGNFDLGLYVALLFLTTIGFAVDLKQFFGSTLHITIFCFCVVIGCTILHLVITRLFKVKYEYVILSIVGAISDGPTAALVASGAQWKGLINIGLLMGVLAGACGNYAGISVAYLIKGVLGL
ncbi:DUF819 domain-containing protein [Romboutsia lituseburensis]|uniref:DUF819 family protein n=1 Tax=Romboutsia lituseburensis TaxID=1537 RepID=UPI00215B607F|nr:DUF819 family protein [Romboutsia lituseburensis]MCR8746805.1 DUF819 family protein [Romboutsia lituseburensis]